jgi:outer membrane biosynthesis protein TonB
MRRRAALAGALALTTIVTFVLVLAGMQGGIFSKKSGGDESTPAVAAESTDDLAGALQYLAAISPVPQQPVTEYVYVDGPAAPPVVRYVTVPSTPASGQAPPAAQPTQVQPAEQPTQPAPSPTRTAPSPTPVAEEEAPAAPPPAPPQQAGPTDETEFTGTVTAIDGNLVTFSHGGTSTVVQVGSGLSSLEIGTTAHVHALLLSSGWVAKEIELGGD